jgi:Ca2+-binding EF-hand superfamily protein
MAMISESARIVRPFYRDDITELRLAFDACDPDADGRVTFVEFESLLESLGSRLSAEQRRAEFSSIDTDGNGLINLIEFWRWWQGR